MGEICRWHKLDQNMMIAVTPLLVVSSYLEAANMLMLWNVRTLVCNTSHVHCTQYWVHSI